MKSRDVLLILLTMSGGFAFAAQEDVPEVAQRKLEEANRHREGGRSEEAIARYREVISATPGVLEAYIGLGALYHESEQYPKALEVFSAGLKRVPNDATLLFNSAATEAKLERFEEALAHTESAVKAGGEDAAIYALRGTVLRRVGKQAEAVEALRKAASLDSKNARAHYNLGNVLYELGRKEEALAAFGQASKLDKDFQPAHYNLGAVLFDLSRFDEALKAYEVALAPVEKEFAKGKDVPPVHARAYLNLGAIFLQRQSWDRALDAYGKAARLDPSLAAAHYNMGYILYHLGRNPEAYPAYEKAVKLDPALPLSYLHMGLIDFAAGRMDKASRFFEDGLPKLAGEDRMRALLALAQAQRALGDLARAEASYRAAVQDDPQEVSALIGLGRLLREEGKLAEARPLLEKAGAIVLDGSGVALELAALARAEGDPAKERAMYEEALRRDGDRPEMWPVRVNLAASMVRSGDVKDARLQMETLMKQADSIRSGSPEVWKQLRTAEALLIAREGNFAAARRELDAVLSGDPAFAPAVNAGAVIDAIAGDMDKASSAFRAILGRSEDASIQSLVRANLGQALWLGGRYDDAREHLLAAAEEFPGNAVV
ncbi:MAG TPA: tetratricopeptide repeat protein, partial [Vicinamibacteria bacterium]|nr:tetratricopeptide repeat protein [Vicinamibacteria bacterium]